MGLAPKKAEIRGRITLKDEASDIILTEMTPGQWRKIRGRRISIAFQEPMSALNPIMTIGKQMMESIAVHEGGSKRQHKEEAIAWLKRMYLPLPEEIFYRYPHQLSGGQKQRVMIAMAMCQRPDIMIADEITTALDAEVQQDIVKLMKDLQEQYGTAYVFITHDLELAGTIANDVLVLYKGETRAYGSAAEVLKTPEDDYTRALLKCKPTPEKKGLRLATVGDVLAHNKGQVMINANVVTQDVVLDVRDLKIWFVKRVSILGRVMSHTKAVDSISFDVRKGETVGLVGKSGSGKSTISRAIMGLLKPREGHIYFEGKDLAHLRGNEWKAVRREVQMIFQDPYASLDPRMRVGDAISEAMMVHDIVPKKQLRSETERLLATVGGGGVWEIPAPVQAGGSVSGWGSPRAECGPKLMICDESVSSLDVSIQAQILNLLKDLQAEMGLSYLFISHDADVVAWMSDRVVEVGRWKMDKIK